MKYTKDDVQAVWFVNEVKIRAEMEHCSCTRAIKMIAADCAMTDEHYPDLVQKMTAQYARGNELTEVGVKLIHSPRRQLGLRDTGYDELQLRAPDSELLRKCAGHVATTECLRWYALKE